MNRRQFAVSLPVAGLLIGCDTKAEQQPSPPSTLLGNPEVQDALKSLDLAIRNLEANVDRLFDETWADVVPDVEASARDVQTTFASFRKASGVSGS